MHICHINLAKEFRGGERQTLLLMQGLSEKGIAQTLVCRKSSPCAELATEIKDIQVITIRKPFLLHILKPNQADLLHAHEGRSCHFTHASHLASSVPYIITRRIPNKPNHRLLTQQAYKKARIIVALSQAIKNHLLEYNHQLTVQVIPSMPSQLMVNHHRVNQLKQKYQKKIIIGHIGALVNHHKGQLTIIEAAKTLQKTHPHLHFLLLGKGKDEAWLKEQAKFLHNIEFVGFVNNVADYIKLFDVFVFPSKEEGLGSILLDIMQFKVPIIASSVDGIPELIQHQQNGLLIEASNPQQLASNIIYLLQHKDQANTLTINGAIRAKEYSIDKITERYLTVYQQVLAFSR